MEKLNVCLINDSFPPAIDGVANAVVNYARIINTRLGHASVVTPYYPDSDDAAFPFPVLRYPSLDTTRSVGYRAGIPFSADIMHQVEQQGFDLIHTHCPITSTMLARSFRDRLNVPVILTYHTKFDIDIANAVRGRLAQEEATRLLVENINACDEVWTVSRGAGENLRKLGYRGSYTVMPNGVDFPRGRVSESAAEKIGEGLDLPGGVPVFLFVGRMMWYKGIRIILDALKTLDEKAVPFRMVFVGGGSDLEEIRAYTEKLALADKVFFVPPIRDREQIRAWYCRADVFLFPSSFDTNGLVVREAASCALGSVLIRGSCAAEDVEDGQSGVLIDENALSMAAALEELCAHPEAMRELGRRAQEELYMSWEDAVNNAYQRYGAVIDSYKSGVYPTHQRFTDEVFAASAQLMDTFYRSRERQRRLMQEMEENRRRFSEEVNEQRLRLERGLEQEKAKMQETLEELYQFMDRFL